MADGHGNVRIQKEEHSSGQEGQMAKHRAGHEPIMVALLGLMETVQVGLAPPETFKEKNNGKPSNNR
jgi:hypothetical protein